MGWFVWPWWPYGVVGVALVAVWGRYVCDLGGPYGVVWYRCRTLGGPIGVSGMGNVP